MELWKMLKKTSKNDSIMLGLISGFLGTIAMDFFNIIMYKMRISEALWAHLSGSIFIPARQTKIPRNFILGQIEHMLTGSLLGIPLAAIFKKTAKKNMLFKGWIYGLTTWGYLLHIPTRLRIYGYKLHTSSAYYSSLIQNSIYGLVTAKIILSLSNFTSDNKSGTLITQEDPKTNTDSNSDKEKKVFDITTKH